MNLLAIFDAAYAKRDNDGTFATEQDCRRAGIAAVVRALRDEVEKIWTSEDMGCGPILSVFNQILGDAGNEKVAGGSSSNADKATEAGGARCATTCASAPATDPCPRCGYPAQDQCDSPGCNIDPAPAVCEWREISVLDGIDHYSTKHGVKNRLHLYRKDDVCPNCKAPIKFTEAKT